MTIVLDMTTTPFQLLLLVILTVANVGSILIFLRMIWSDLSSSLTIKKDNQTILLELVDRLERLDVILDQIEGRADMNRSQE